MEVDPRQAIHVSSVNEEYEILALKRCECEGRFQVVRQTLLSHGEGYYDLLETSCQQCGRQQDFLFDISSFFKR
jgi:hypothetical protein